MVKAEELFDKENLSEKSKSDYEAAVNDLNDIEALVKGNDFENVFELEGEEWERYRFLRSQLMKKLIRIVKQEDREFDFTVLSSHFGNPRFWKEIRDTVSEEVRNFLQMQPIRKTEFQDREKRYREIFDILYIEYETAEYVSCKLHMDRELVALYIRILRAGENMIINRFCSKRIFILRIQNYFGLYEKDGDILWKLYCNKRELVEKIAFSNRLSDIEYRLSRMALRLEDIQEKVDFLDCLEDDEEDELIEKIEREDGV